jgi:hypothetical protein
MYDGAVCSWIRTGACLLACLCFASVQQSLICLTPGSLEPPIPRKDPPNPLCVRARPPHERP